MLVFSPRFAVLACLCAALPLAFPPPVEAAHLYDSHTMGKHSASRPHHQSPVASPTHGYGGKHNGQYKPPRRRVPDFPPLLQRHGARDQMNAQDRHGQGPHDYAHTPKSTHSAFARSRYRREPGTQSRRSSVYVPGDHGGKYVVTRTSPNNRGNERKGKERKSPRAHDRRQLDESNVALGRVDIMSGVQLTNTTQRLASLMVESTPIDWTSGQSAAKAFPLNASTINQTQFIMMPMDEPVDAGGGFTKHVALATEVFDASSAEMVMYCATYDPDPGSTSALLMTPCTGETQPAASENDLENDAADPCSDDAIDGSSSDVHQSQLFAYDPSTGKIEPISAAASSSAVDDSSDDQAGCAAARVRRDTGSSTTSSSTTPSSTSTSTAPIASTSQQARNVTLVYVPGALEVPASASNSTSASIGQGPVFTTTITTTVTANGAASGPSTRTVAPARAAVSASVSSMPSSTTTAPAAPSTSSSSLPTTTLKTPANANESLQVEVVGFDQSTTARFPSPSSGTRTMATTTTHSSVTPTLNAEAVAWSISNQRTQARIQVTAVSSR